MSAFSTIFKPKPGKFAQNVAITSAAVGTGGIALTATATVSVNIPVPNRKAQLLGLVISAKTAAAGGSTITAQAFKRNNQKASPADVTLTAAKDITATVITTSDATYAFAFTTTADSDLMFFPPAYAGGTFKGDTLRVDLAAATTVTTAPQLVISATWAIVE